MRDSFHRNVIEEHEKTILFIGGGGKSSLIRRLRDDCLSLGKKTLIFSLFPASIPKETDTILTETVDVVTTILPKKIKKEKCLFVGSRYDDSILYPFSEKELSRIINEVDTHHVFIEADSVNGKSLSSLKKVPAMASVALDRCVLVIGADALNQNYASMWLDSRDRYWKENNVISPLSLATWYYTNKTIRRFVRKKIPVTVFINKVESIFSRNLAVALAKELKKEGIERVICGSVLDSEIQVIK